jgi:starvation-inducible DNA-binding protein
MNPTRNTLPDKIRQQVCSQLNQLLADVADLTLQSKQAHWAVKGPNFIALHKLFDEVYGHASEWTDEIAERIAELGGQPQGTLQAAAKNTRLEAYPLDLVAERGHVERLTHSLATFGSFVRSSIDDLARIGDADSADLCTEISRAVDKDLWFVESHLG